MDGLEEVERNFSTHRFSHSLQHGKERDTPLSALCFLTEEEEEEENIAASAPSVFSRSVRVTRKPERLVYEFIQVY